ncbi:MAG: hypothetical protein ACODAD_09330, partial [Planctomycetota bacterium]
RGRIPHAADQAVEPLWDLNAFADSGVDEFLFQQACAAELVQPVLRLHGYNLFSPDDETVFCARARGDVQGFGLRNRPLRSNEKKRS